MTSSSVQCSCSVSVSLSWVSCSLLFACFVLRFLTRFLRYSKATSIRILTASRSSTRYMFSLKIHLHCLQKRRIKSIFKLTMTTGKPRLSGAVYRCIPSYSSYLVDTWLVSVAACSRVHSWGRSEPANRLRGRLTHGMTVLKTLRLSFAANSKPQEFPFL